MLNFKIETVWKNICLCFLITFSAVKGYIPTLSGFKRKPAEACGGPKIKKQADSSSGLPTPPPIHRASRLSLGRHSTQREIPMTNTRRDDLLQVQANLFAGLQELTAQIATLVSFVGTIAAYFQARSPVKDEDNATTE